VRHNYFGRDAESLINKVREALKSTPRVRRQWPFMAGAAAWLMVPHRWRRMALSAAVLLLGWIGLHQIGVPVWAPWTPRAEHPDPPQADKANAAADAAATRKAEEAEQQRQAAAKAEEERKAREATAAAKAEADRQAAAKAEAERQAAAKAEEERKAKAAAEAEAKRKAAAEAEQQRLATVKAEEDRKAATPADTAAQFTIRSDTAASGYPSNYESAAHSAKECELICARSATCKIFTFDNKALRCYVYSTADDVTYLPNRNYIAGTRK
jgi:PAN domain